MQILAIRGPLPVSVHSHFFPHSLIREGVHCVKEASGLIGLAELCRLGLAFVSVATKRSDRGVMRSRGWPFSLLSLLVYSPAPHSLPFYLDGVYLVLSTTLVGITERVSGIIIRPVHSGMGFRDVVAQGRSRHL